MFRVVRLILLTAVVSFLSGSCTEETSISEHSRGVDTDQTLPTESTEYSTSAEVNSVDWTLEDDWLTNSSLLSDEEYLSYFVPASQMIKRNLIYDLPPFFFDERSVRLLECEHYAEHHHCVLLLAAASSTYRQFVESNLPERFETPRWSLNCCFGMLFGEETAGLTREESVGAYRTLAREIFIDGLEPGFKMAFLPDVALAVYLAGNTDQERRSRISEIDSALSTLMDTSLLRSEAKYLFDYDSE